MTRHEHICAEVREFAERIKALGFRVFLAERGKYGIITDTSEARVLSFGFEYGGRLSGNHLGNRETGSGWMMDETPDDLKTADDVRKALYAPTPRWGRDRRGNAPPHAKLDDYLSFYQSSSRYVEL